MASSFATAPAPLPGLASPFAVLFGAFSDSLSRARQITALSALSDAELAERGLRRGEIARFVAHDDYWR
jgi:hypothetical protein